MILSIAISLLALSKPIHASAKATRGRNLAKSAKEAPESSRSVGGGAPSLKPYSYTPPADFSGMYYPCFASITRNSASGILPGVYHYCPKDTDDVLYNFVEDLLQLNITSKDAFGAYYASNEYDLEEEFPPQFFGDIKMTPWEGQARGNKLFMDTYGAGSTSEGVLERPNDTPDHKECSLFQSNVLECLTTLEEYCTLVEGVEESSICKDKDGQWQYTYEIWLVSAQDLEDCPAAPENFCDSNPIPTAAGAFERHLKDEAKQDEEERATCPLLRK